jgi:Holliday junction resolvase
MPKESQLWTLVKQHIPKDAHVQRIETGLTGKGVPDLNYCQNGKEIWIELKSIRGNKSQLSPFQIAWIHNRAKAGGNCYVLIRKNKEIRLFQPKTLEELQELNWNSEPAIGTTAPYDWAHLFSSIYHSAK